MNITVYQFIAIFFTVAATIIISSIIFALCCLIITCVNSTSYLNTVDEEIQDIEMAELAGPRTRTTEDHEMGSRSTI